MTERVDVLSTPSEDTMEIGERLHLSSREEWRAWLAEHHQNKQEI